jgi:CBS domain-containing membrane protein
VFAAPASPLAQPWSVVGGNLLSAVVGMICAAWIPDVVLAAACAVALAIGAMLMLRCLHPPGGALALLAVLAHSSAGHFPLGIALSNSLLLVGAGLLYNPLTGKRYPHAQIAPAQPAPNVRERIQGPDLDAALVRYNQVLDVSRDDLEALLLAAELEGHRRRLGDIRCRDVMARDPLSVEFGTTLQEAWELMQVRHIKALPVVDRGRRVVGILTSADILRAARLDWRGNFAARLRTFLRSDGLTHSEKPEVVGQVMTRAVRAVGQDVHVLDLLSIFNETGHHHLPIVDADRRIVGVLTQSDFVRALQQGNYLSAQS